MAREYTRRFTVQPGTVIDGITIPARTFTATREGNTKSPAQRAARRDAAAYVSSIVGRTVGPTELNRATAPISKATGRGRGGRKRKTEAPNRLAGFRRVSTRDGIETWERKGRGNLSDAYSAIARFTEARATRRRDGQLMAARVSVRGMYDEKTAYWSGSGAEMEVKSWGSTATFDIAAFRELYPGAWALEYGPNYQQDQDPNGGTGIDFDTVDYVSIHVDTGERS